MITLITTIIVTTKTIITIIIIIIYSSYLLLYTTIIIFVIQIHLPSGFTPGSCGRGSSDNETGDVLLFNSK